MRIIDTCGRWGWAAVCLCGPLAATLAAQPYGFGFGNAAKFFPSADVAASAPPSFVFEFPPRSPKAIPADFEIVPEYSAENGRTTATLSLPDGASLYGLGSSPGGLLRNGATVDVSAIPWVLVVGANGASFGVLPDTTFPCRVSLDGAIRITSSDSRLPIVILKAATPGEVLQGLNELTGRMEMPPRWALGYHQYAPKGDVGIRAGAAWLRETGVPADVIWLEHLDNSAAGWNLTLYPDPPKLVADLKALGLRVVSGLPAWMPQKAGDSVYDAGTASECWVLLDSGSAATRTGGSDSLVLPDFTREATRKWWSGLIDNLAKGGVAGFVLPRRNQLELPPAATLRGDPALGGPGHAEQYGMVLPTLSARATVQGAGGEKADRRPFVSADAPALTLQRSAAVVLRSPGRDWDSLRALIPAALNTTLSGHPLVGVEIPDFGGSDPALGRRWTGLAATFPLSVGRFELANDSPMLTPEFKKTLTAAMQRRYRLIPYYYSLCFDAFFRCEPIMRPLFLADPSNPTLRGRDDAFMLGTDLLVVPRLSEAAEDAACPLTGRWKKLDLGVSETPDLPAIYLRPGAILPLGPVGRDTGDGATDPITLVINPDENGNAEGFLYEDDGDGYAFYRNQCRRIGYAAIRQGDAVLVRLSRLDGGSQLPKRKLEIRLLADTGEIRASGSEKGTVKIDLPAATPPSQP